MPPSPPPKPIRKKLVTDEQHRPVAVQIDYHDWLEIERRLGLRDIEATERVPTPGDFDRLLEDTAGIWSEGDGLEYQRRIRDEWTRAWDHDARKDS